MIYTVRNSTNYFTFCYLTKYISYKVRGEEAMLYDSVFTRICEESVEI